MSFFAELKRRKVIQLAIVYLVAAMLILEGADVLVPALALPEWVLRLVALLLILGFPLSLVMAWHFDLTSTGVIRTGSGDNDGPPAETPDTEIEVIDALSFEENPDVTAPAKASVAVLPFVNMSGDEDNEYFRMVCLKNC